MQRSYQFKEFFKTVSIEWDGEEMYAMCAKVKNKSLLHEPFWDFSYPKEKLFRFWKKIFDPRLDTYYEQWKQLFKENIGDHY